MTIQEASVIRFARFHTETYVRLADQAERDGIHIVVLNDLERHVAIDPRLPVALESNIEGSTCKEWKPVGKRVHHALLYAELRYGTLPEESELTEMQRFYGSLRVG